MEELALGSLRHRGLSALLRAWPRPTSGGASAMGRSPSTGEYEGLTPSSRFPPAPNPANSTKGNGSGDVCRPPRRPTPVEPKKDY